MQFERIEMWKHNDVVSLKLLIDEKRQIVLFAEASESLSSLLSHMLSQPVGALISLLRQQEMGAGFSCIAKLCKSIENMKLNLAVAAANSNGVYASSVICHKYNPYGPSIVKYSDDSLRVFPTRPIGMGYAGQPRRDGGGVVFSYLITDDLEVIPLSTISIMTQLNKFGVKDAAALEEKHVHLGLNEAAKLLSASLQSKTPLTDVFLPAKPRANGVKRERVDGDVM